MEKWNFHIYIYETNSVVSKKILIKVKCFHNGGVVKKALSRCWKRNSFIVATREERLVKPLSVISIRYHLVHSSICAAVLRAVSSSLEFESKTNLQSIDGPRNVCTLLQVNYAKSRVLIVCIQPREILVSELFIRCCDRNPSFLQRSLQSLRIKEKQQQ